MTGCAARQALDTIAETHLGSPRLELGVASPVVMEIGGPAGLDMTRNTYGHVRLDMTRQALDQLSDLFTDTDREHDGGGQEHDGAD